MHDYIADITRNRELGKNPQDEIQSRSRTNLVQADKERRITETACYGTHVMTLSFPLSRMWGAIGLREME
jgi:hypothetical protein